MSFQYESTSRDVVTKQKSSVWTIKHNHKKKSHFYINHNKYTEDWIDKT